MRIARSWVATHGTATRAQLVLDCADAGVAEAARRSGVSPTTVSKWWRRYSEFGIDGLSDNPRTGRPTASTDTVAAVLRCALLTPPADGNRWSTHTIAEHTGTSQATVSRIRRRVFPRSDPGTELLPDSATAVLAYVDVEVAGCAIGMMPARGGVARNSPALVDAVETIVCAALIRRPHDGYGPPEHVGTGSDGATNPAAGPRAVDLLRRAADRLPPSLPYTLLIDVELDPAARRWLMHRPELQVHALTPEAWLATVQRIASTVDPQQLKELQQVQGQIREVYAAGGTGFTWVRTGESTAAKQVDAAPPEPSEPVAGDPERVVQAICAALVHGELGAGDPVTVRSVSRRAGISAGRVAEALARLAEEALLDRRCGQYLLPVPQARDVVETYTARGLLGTAIARRLAGAQISPSPAAYALHDRIVTCDRLGLATQAYRLDLDLQNEIARTAAMPRIGWMFIQLSLQLSLFTTIIGLDYQYPTDEIVTDDRRVLDTIAGGDPEAAVNAWREKTDNCARYMLRALRAMSARQPGPASGGAASRGPNASTP
jgi:DNA-binding GntR family transcriptional regulator